MQSCILAGSSARFASNTFSFDHGSARSTFNDYHVKELYRVTLAPAMLNQDQRTFRTIIRKGAKATVEFAVHYTVPQWGCGPVTQGQGRAEFIQTDVILHCCNRHQS